MPSAPWELGALVYGTGTAALQAAGTSVKLGEAFKASALPPRSGSAPGRYGLSPAQP